MAVYDDDFFETIAAQFIESLLENLPDQFRRVCDCSRLVSGLVYLTEIIPREYDCVLHFSSAQSHFSCGINVSS